MSTPQHGPSSDLRIADLPEDVRPEAERLKAEYHALATEAGLLNAAGQFEVQKLDDAAFVLRADPTVLRELVQVGEWLRELSSPLRAEYYLLSEEARAYISLPEFVDTAFSENAAAHGFSPFQWAGVCAMLRQPGMRGAPEGFIPVGRHGLTMDGDIDLRGGDLLTMLPQGLTVNGSLRLDGCTGLQKLPDDLNVTGDLSVRGCRRRVKAMAAALKVGRQVGGRVFT